MRTCNMRRMIAPFYPDGNAVHGLGQAPANSLEQKDLGDHASLFQAPM